MSKSTPQQTSKKKTLREKAAKQKKAAVKSILQKPFKTVWPSVSSKKRQEVLEYFERLLEPLHIKDKYTGELKKTDPRAVKIRSNFVLGVNSVTRLLEKDQLALVLVCQSAHPPIIVKHLAELSAVRRCPAMLLFGLNALLSSKLKLHSAVTVGFKKKEYANDDYFEEFISFVDPPEIHFPYLNNHVATFTICKKGNKLNEQMSRRNVYTTMHSEYPHRKKPLGQTMHSEYTQRKKPLGQSQSLVTTSYEPVGISKVSPQKAVRIEKKPKDSFKSNENFISLGSITDDHELKGLDLNFHHVKTLDSIWEEIYAMRIVDKQNSKGIPITRKDVDPVEINRSKLFTVGDEKTQTSKPVFGAWKKTPRDHKKKKKSKIWTEKPEYRVSEIKKIKGNVDKKKMKKEKLVKSVKEKPDKNKKEKSHLNKEKPDKNKKEKSHLNKKNKSKLIKKLQKALKKINDSKL